MTEQYEDDALLADLVEALQATRPRVAEVSARGRGAFTWRTIDEELLTAELSFDSADAPATTSRRTEAAGANRVLVFTTELRSVEIEVLADRLVGQFIPGLCGRVEIETAAGVVAEAEVDELGFFVVERAPAGRIRLRCSTPSTRLVTAWVDL